jgi:phage gp36-like protein
MYATAAELEKATGFQYQVIMADYTDPEKTVELERVLTEASGVIDDMVVNRVAAVPVTGSVALMKRLCLALAKYDIFSSIARDQVPEAVLQDKQDAMKTLEKIQKGELVLQDGSTDADAVVESEFDSTAQVVDTWMD